MSTILRVLSNTVLKRRPVASSQLDKSDMVSIKAGMDFELHSHALEPAKNHVRVAFTKDVFKGLNTWYAYVPHIQIVEAVDRKPEGVPAISFNPEFKDKSMGTAFKVPGISATLYSNQPIGKAKNFFWYEATHGLTRMPETEAETAAIIRIAEAAQQARDQVRQSFVITSWFRPEPWNSSAGGASQSRHLYGDAIDFYIEGWSTHQMYQAFDSWWFGGVGKYRGLDICHLDARGWNARWFN